MIFNPHPPTVSIRQPYKLQKWEQP